MAPKVKPTSTPGDDLAAEAWGLLIPLVYPPRFIEIAHNLGVTPSILGALRFLEQPQPMGRMAELLHCDPSNVTGIVDTLEERNLAKRKPSEADRRVKVVELTAAEEAASPGERGDVQAPGLDRGAFGCGSAEAARRP